MELDVSSNLINGRWTVREFQKQMAKYVYRKGIDLHSIKSNDFREIIQFINGHQAYKTPNSKDLNGWILDEVQQEIEKYIKDVKESWKDTGCSIVLDGWENRIGSHMINVLVSSPKGTIYYTSIYHNDNNTLQTLLEQILVEIGEDNVVQIISHSTSETMRELGKRLMSKFKRFFWTVSGSHCIELILKKIGRMNLVANVMEKAKTITRFIHGNGSVLKLFKEKLSVDGLITPSISAATVPYLTLLNIEKLKPSLEKTIRSRYWIASNWSSTEKGKQFSATIVDDHSFWSGLRQVLIPIMPILNFQTWMLKTDIHVGFIYETMDQLKEVIKLEMRKASLNHVPYWEAIDEVWNEHLHCPLHAMGYFLNPTLCFANDFNPDKEVSVGILRCAARLAKDIENLRQFSDQLEEYQIGGGAFGNGIVKDERNSCASSPVDWWLKYGKAYPELQQIAIRVLSQTCDGALKFCLDKKMAEKLFYVKRNDTDQERQSLLTSIHYNLCLQNFESTTEREVSIYDMDGIQDWIMDKPQHHQPTASSSTALKRMRLEQQNEDVK